MSRAGSCWGYIGVSVLVHWQCIICLVCHADSNSVFSILILIYACFLYGFNHTGTCHLILCS
ncbi:hypothetical protein OIU79_024882 [Salix purpurea]|uniref:Uncharacterized protein n=1 Tax=Salix purpurea TaxID=77065 RepID=A0A9Q0W3L3_SALPP|nr:hypothetical protein OIU79_024882 [Salix purpurea]